MPNDPVLAQCFDRDVPGLVAVMNRPVDLEFARTEHWYRIPVRSAPENLDSCRWVAFYLTAAFGPDKWAVRHWGPVINLTEVRRVDLLPSEADHPRASARYWRLGLGPLRQRPEPIFNRRRRRIVFIPSLWHKFVSALEINDLHHGSPLEDRLWAALKQADIEAERQWFEGNRKRLYCLDFVIFCNERNVDVECDGDRWHCDPERARQDNVRNNFLEQRGWHVLRFSSAQINHELPECIQGVKQIIHRCGGMRPLVARGPGPPAAADPGQGPMLGIESLLELSHRTRRKPLLRQLDVRHGTARLVTALVKALETVSPRFRGRAVWCLGELGPNPVAVEALEAWLATETHCSVRRLASSACAKMRAAELEEAILAKLPAEEAQVLQYALHALARCGTQVAMEPIRRILSQKHPEYVKRAAEKAVRRCNRWW
jgi:very-short-patch-repair endonuclease